MKYISRITPRWRSHFIEKVEKVRSEIKLSFAGTYASKSKKPGFLRFLWGSGGRGFKSRHSDLLIRLA
ncbi:MULTISPECIES: hypothetical protein [unclassified Microcoleus]|uniref:hypothetical protein n=1 Tax=unclassified Microcoleus TaxID=2642155 RepID=UPI002FD1C866